MSNTDQFKEEDTYSEAATVARREAALKRTLATPHKPQRPIRDRKGDEWPQPLPTEMLTSEELEGLGRDMKEAGDWAREELRKNPL